MADTMDPEIEAVLDHLARAGRARSQFKPYQQRRKGKGRCPRGMNFAEYGRLASERTFVEWQQDADDLRFLNARWPDPEPPLRVSIGDWPPPGPAFFYPEPDEKWQPPTWGGTR